MRKDTYENKLSDYSIQISSAKEKDYVMRLLWRKDINNVLLAMRKKDEASENLYTNLHHKSTPQISIWPLKKKKLN